MIPPALHFLEDLEGREATAYECAAHCLTIGIGHRLTPEELQSGIIRIDGDWVHWRKGLSDAHIDALAIQDWDRALRAVSEFVDVPLHDHQRVALASFVFNVGRTAFMDSTLRKVLNQGRYEAVPEQLSRWDKVTDRQGQKVRSTGLAKRREREIALWNDPSLLEA